MNLLRETKADIHDSGHTPEDIVFIGSRETGHQCTWKEFQELADIEYDSGFGAAEVAQDLEIVFDDGTTMWRHEYDGSECWLYSYPFKKPKASKPIERLIVPEDRVGWMSLEEIHNHLENPDF